MSETAVTRNPHRATDLRTQQIAAPENHDHHLSVLAISARLAVIEQTTVRQERAAGDRGRLARRGASAVSPKRSCRPQHTPAAKAIVQAAARGRAILGGSSRPLQRAAERICLCRPVSRAIEVALTVLVQGESGLRRHPGAGATAAGCTNRIIWRPAAIRTSRSSALPQPRESRLTGEFRRSHGVVDDASREFGEYEGRATRRVRHLHRWDRGT